MCHIHTVLKYYFPPTVRKAHFWLSWNAVLLMVRDYYCTNPRPKLPQSVVPLQLIMPPRSLCEMLKIHYLALYCFIKYFWDFFFIPKPSEKVCTGRAAAGKRDKAAGFLLLFCCCTCRSIFVSGSLGALHRHQLIIFSFNALAPVDSLVCELGEVYNLQNEFIIVSSYHQTRRPLISFFFYNHTSVWRLSSLVSLLWFQWQWVSAITW